MTKCTGWDIGGAHVKVALADGGRILKTSHTPSLIWTDLKDLEAAICSELTEFGGADLHGVTMTGELAEVFEDRRQGVAAIVDLMTDALHGKEVKIFAGRSGFVSADKAAEESPHIASANWLASAQYVALKRKEALFADIGSTTTDLIPICKGAPSPAGFSDAARLQAGELVYTGLVRTPVMAVSRHVPFEGRLQTLMGERFAVMADVYRILGLLPEEADQFPAVDGRKKTKAASRARLARMLGRDVIEAEIWQWEAVARYLSDAQLQTLEAEVHLVFSRAAIMPSAPFICAGSGAFLLRRLAERMGHPHHDFACLVERIAPVSGEEINRSAAAVAIALLLSGS